MRRRIVAIFENAEDAREAADSLRHAGIPEGRITVSVGLGREDTAAEVTVELEGTPRSHPDSRSG
jgi:hypothetical protein